MTEALPLSPQAIAEWLPFWKAFGFFLATFVLEDLAAVGAGLLLATGAISWPAAFTACFLGIWMGDAGLYALARYGGRRWFERSSLKRFAGKVEQSERWFAQRGTAILIFSRMMPGARLPTYLAAGFLRVPFPRFLLVTGAASFVWTFVILFLAKTFGEQLVGWLSAYKYGGLAVFGTGLVLFAMLQLLRRAFMNFDWRRTTAKIGRWRHWEFWPAWMFYPPVGIYCVWLAIKYRGITMPTTSNPGIFSGGMVGESKTAMLKELSATSPEFTVEAELIPAGAYEERLSLLDEILAKFSEGQSDKRTSLTPALSHPMGEGELSAASLRNPGPEKVGNAPVKTRHGDSFSLSRRTGEGQGEGIYPFILKPDLGQRGDGVKLIRTREQAEAYLRHTSAPLVVQRYAPGPLEAGVFYYRFPHEKRGHIFAITEKIFPVLIGDGRSTISELIRNDARARFMADKYLLRFDGRQNEVLPAGVELKLVEAGNHAQGCIFRDGMRLCTPALMERIDGISQKLPGFFIGRYDIRYASEEDLMAGRNFQIIELNGAASEATSIYDSRNSLFDAYLTLFKQWELVFAIGAANRKRGCQPTKLSLVWRKRCEYSRLAATYPTAD